MLNIKIITVGRLKEKYLRDACSEYLKRLKRFGNVRVIELDEYRLSDNPSDREIEGKQLSSVKLAEKISQISVDGQSNISFIIGSSFGIAENVKKKVDFKLSMSDMTFPHQLARVMLLEQIYRAFQINNNGKYHK